MKIDPSSERNEDAVLGRRRGLEPVKATNECFCCCCFFWQWTSINGFLGAQPTGRPAVPLCAPAAHAQLVRHGERQPGLGVDGDGDGGGDLLFLLNVSAKIKVFESAFDIEIQFP